jgi:hypothetical protein
MEIILSIGKNSFVGLLFSFGYQLLERLYRDGSQAELD